MKLISYKMTHDTGFAPNPFFGVLTIATCKPGIRRSSTRKKGDWIAGFGSKTMCGDQVGKERLIFLMEVTEEPLSIKDYYHEYIIKRPIMYGRADFLALMQTKHPSVVDSHIERGICYSVPSPYSPSDSHQSSPASAPTPPKNEASYKVHVPAKFKADLEKCATYRKHSISSYSRQVILTHLYGYLPYDHELFGEHPPVGIDED